MIGLYLLALVPMAIGGFAMLHNRRIALQEWAIASALGLITSVIVHITAISGMTSDVQLYSGEIVNATYYPAWLEYYEYAVYRTEFYECGDSKNPQTCSRQVFDHWEPDTRWHNEHSTWFSNIDTEYEIDKATFDEVVRNFKDIHKVKGVRSTWDHNSHMIKGDPNDYESLNQTGYIYPVNEERNWSNKIKACPSVFSFAEVPETIKVYNWGQTKHPYVSWRVMGHANEVIALRDWDNWCAKIGPLKKINPVIIGFPEDDESIAEWQRAKWIGGKKNDLVICYGGPNDKPNWCKVFGWSDSAICKQTIQSHIMQHGVNKELISFLNKEIIENYQIKDWSEFDYLRVEIPASCYYILIAILTVTQCVLYFFFHRNDFDREDYFGKISKRYSA